MTAARLGGDEFALLVQNYGGASEISDIARRVKDALATPMYLEGLRFEVGVSIGIALAPDDGRDGAVLLQRADIAMYEAKAGRGGGIEFFHPDRNSNNPRRLTLTNDLRSAIAAGQLTLHYQPKARLHDGHIFGVEALVRWRHPELGLVPPDEFIPIAERTGLITELTAYVLETALHQVRDWHQSGLDWSVAVNLSMRNLIDTGLTTSIANLLASTGVRPDRVTLEITETSVMSDATRSIKVLGDLAALGVSISIDDFGTGYSSLSYLQRLPVDEIKIDKSFVMAMTTDDSARAIVRSILDLAGHLGLSVVAEGVEHREIWDLLRSLGCDVAQGYFLARPMPAADVAHWLEQERGRDSWRLSA